MANTPKNPKTEYTMATSKYTGEPARKAVTTSNAITWEPTKFRAVNLSAVVGPIMIRIIPTIQDPSKKAIVQSIITGNENSILTPTLFLTDSQNCP